MSLMIGHKKKLLLILWLSLVNAAFAASSRFVVITPANETRHPFLVQVKAVADDNERSRIRVIGAVDGGQRAWLILCETYLNSCGSNFRNVLWFSAMNAKIERVTRLTPEQTTLSKSEKKTYSYVEVELSHEQMRRAYIYIDYPRQIDDGGGYYSIDLAYYLEGSRGKKSVIQWETQ
jgi:hypothetical protein